MNFIWRRLSWRRLSAWLTMGFLVLVTNLAYPKVTLTVAVWSWSMENYKRLASEYVKMNPDVAIELVPIEPALVGSFFSARVASKQPLPDVVAECWENLSFFVTQGWVYPLDDFIKGDRSYGYVPKLLKSYYTYRNKTYAIPERVHFSTIVVNLDLLRKLNLQRPTYLWTIDTFKSYARKATTREFSGINHLWDFDSYMSAMFSQTHGYMGYNTEKREFDMVRGGWIDAIKLQCELKSIPGLVADDLKNEELRKQGLLDDYQRKFGKDADAWRESKVLLGFHGTWDWWWLRSLPWDFDFYPLPMNPRVGLKLLLHTNFAFMTSTTRYPKEAFQFLKFITYDPKGIATKMRVLLMNGEENGRLVEWFIPPSLHPDTIKLLDNLKIPDGVKWMFKNLDRGFPIDMWKYVPNTTEVWQTIVTPAGDRVRRGEVQAESIAPEVQERANRAIKAAWEDFFAKLDTFERSFPELRRQLERR